MAGKVSIDADITIRATWRHARDLDGMKDPGKRDPPERFLAIQTGRLTDIPDEECQCRHEQCTEYGIPDRHVLLTGFVDTHHDYHNKNRQDGLPSPAHQTLTSRHPVDGIGSGAATSSVWIPTYEICSAIQIIIAAPDAASKPRCPRRTAKGAAIPMARPDSMARTIDVSARAGPSQRRDPLRFSTKRA